MTVSSSNVIVENLEMNSTFNYIDYFNKIKSNSQKKVNHNITYGFEYVEDGEMKLVNFGVIGDQEVRFMNENGPTHKTYKRVTS